MNTFRSIRERLGLTQAALAESLGVTQGNIAHYEKDQGVPPHIAKRLIERAKELGHTVTYDDIYADESEPDTPTTDRRKSPQTPQLERETEPVGMRVRAPGAGK